MTVPIVALTANAMESDKGKCISAGMQGFVAKPFTTEILLSSIQKVITKEAPDKMPKIYSQLLSTANPLDKDILITLKKAMEDDFEELLPAFFENSRQIISDLWNAKSSQQFEILQRNAHSLKSSSANLGALNLSSLAKSLELQCKENKAVESQQLNAIEDEYSRVETALKAF